MKATIFVIILVTALLLWIQYYIAKKFYFIAKEKGYDKKQYLWLSFFFGMIGYLLVVALPDRGACANDELPEL